MQNKVICLKIISNKENKTLTHFKYDRDGILWLKVKQQIKFIAWDRKIMYLNIG